MPKDENSGILIYAQITRERYIHTVFFELVEKARTLSQKLGGVDVSAVIFANPQNIEGAKSAFNNMGVNKVEYFKNGFDKYLKDNNLTFESSILEIPKSKNKRPTNIELFDYLKSSITSDHPIAFLNLNHGKEKRLESWHWVLIIGITYDKEEGIINANIADQGEIKTINLTLWLETTLLGGGFIYYK